MKAAVIVPIRWCTVTWQLFSDHAGGTRELFDTYKGQISIYGFDERINKLTNKVADGDKLTVIFPVAFLALASAGVCAK